MKVKELRELLKAKKATWKLPTDIDDQADIEKLFAQQPVGSLTPPPGMLTSRQPRMRRAADGAILAWQPNLAPRLRPALKKLPKTWDWRNVNNQNWVVPVRDQGGCGSCVAFAATAAVEAHQRIETGRADANLDLSESSLFFVNNRQCNFGDPNYGWWIPSALDFLVSEGICYEENYPYRPVNQTAQLVDGTERTFKITGYDSTGQANLMKRWLCEEGPLVTSFTVHQDFFAFWHSNNEDSQVYTNTVNNPRGGHAVLTVGYDDAKSCWICKNSWQPHQGNDAFFRIGYGQCGIDNRMYLIQDVYDVCTVDEIPYNPNRLRIVNEGARGWLLTDGASRMKMFDTAEDARNGLRVARRHNRQGFVGRDNPRANRIDYIMEYWAGNSGLPHEPLTRTDAIPYNPNNVVSEDLNAQGWRIKDGNSWMLLAHDMNDALATLRVVERHSRMCFIGRGNNRPNRKNYIMTYWE